MNIQVDIMYFELKDYTNKYFSKIQSNNNKQTRILMRPSNDVPFTCLRHLLRRRRLRYAYIVYANCDINRNVVFF